MTLNRRHDITIIGAGNGGYAFAAYVARLGYNVNLCFRTLQHVLKLTETKKIRATGAFDGVFRLNMVTSNWEKAIKRSMLILIVVPADGHEEIIYRIAPFLKNGQSILLNPGRTWGAISAYNIIKQTNPSVNVHVGETQTLLFTCRREGADSVKILKIKDKVDYCFYPEAKNITVKDMLEKLFPQMQPVYDIRLTSLNNIGAVVHPATAVLNAGAIGRGHEFLFYRQGITEEIVRIVEKIDAERCAVMEHIGMPVYTFLDWVQDTYNVKASTFLEAFQKIESYATINSPESVDNRYLTEDIPTGLVPLASLGAYFGIPMPNINSIIQIGSSLLGKDFLRIGRTIDNVGLPQAILDRALSSFTPRLEPEELSS